MGTGLVQGLIQVGFSKGLPMLGNYAYSNSTILLLLKLKYVETLGALKSLITKYSLKKDFLSIFENSSDDVLGFLNEETNFSNFKNAVDSKGAPSASDVKDLSSFKNWVNQAGDDLLSFVNKTLAQKLDDIKGIWNTKYPIQEMLEGRSFFEDIMGQYRYLKSSGWSHTGDISEFFKGVDFYKGTTQGANIFAETAVSMKTTITTNVDNWLASAPIKKNLQFLNQGKSVDGLLSNGKTMFITNAEIHIYMPKANITEALKTTWMNKLNTSHPGIKFEIKALEDFVN